MRTGCADDSMRGVCERKHVVQCLLYVICRRVGVGQDTYTLDLPRLWLWPRLNWPVYITRFIFPPTRARDIAELGG